MSFDADPNAATVVPARPKSAPPPKGVSVAGRNTSLPGYSPTGLVDRAVDRYQIVKTLGAGGMGEVALVQDHDINRTVAVKFLHSEMAEPPLVARFVEEIRNVGQLEHPNIVPIHDAGKDDAGRYFFVMKHLEGETLETIIDRLREGDPAYLERYPHLQRVEIFIGILNALKFAHEKGFVHRDLKPANVMVGHSGEVVVMDWGLSKSLRTAEEPPAAIAASAAFTSPSGRLTETQAGAVLGTPLYMSPEQAQGRNDAVDVRSDLYSAVALFHELMFLEHYLEGRETMEEILAGVLGVIPKTYFEYVRYPRAPAPYLHICRKGLQKDPALRFQSAAELIDRLRQVLDGSSPIECAGTAMRRGATEFTRLVDRRPRAAMFVYGLLACSLLTSLGTLGWWLAHAL